MASPRSAATGGLGFRGGAAGKQSSNAGGGGGGRVSSADSQNGSSTNVPVQMRHARRTSSGRFMNLSRDESEMGGVTDSEMGSEFLYTVQIPATPDNQPMSGTPSVRPMDPGIAGKAEQQFVSSTIFTGGFKSVTRGHVMEKMMEGEGNHPQLACARGAVCAVEGCDGKAMRDERGENMAPCDCQFRICRDCYIDALNGSGKCPGCKDEYKIPDEPLSESGTETDMRALPPPTDDTNRLERRLSLLKTKPGLLMSNQGTDFDHARWLYQTKGTYGYGNALWPKDDGYNDGGGPPLPPMGALPDFNDKARRPLSRKVRISAGILSPYRQVTQAFSFFLSPSLLMCLNPHCLLSTPGKYSRVMLGIKSPWVCHEFIMSSVQ